MHEKVASRFHILASIVPLRDKDEFEPVMPLPRWTGWVMAGWTLGTVAFYTTVLARWWE